MRSRKTWRRGIILLAALLLFTITSEGGYPQSTPPTLPPPVPSIPSYPQPANHVVRNPSAPAPQLPNVEELLNQITAIRAQKAELDKQEQALVKTLRERLAAQKQRLTKLGLTETAPSPPTEAGAIPPTALSSPFPVK